MGASSNYDSWLTSQPDGVEEFEHFADQYCESESFIDDARAWADKNPKLMWRSPDRQLDDEQIVDEYCQSDEFKEAVEHVIQCHRDYMAEAILDSEYDN